MTVNLHKNNHTVMCFGFGSPWKCVLWLSSVVFKYWEWVLYFSFPINRNNSKSQKDDEKVWQTGKKKNATGQKSEWHSGHWSHCEQPLHVSFDPVWVPIIVATCVFWLLLCPSVCVDKGYSSAVALEYHELLECVTFDKAQVSWRQTSTEHSQSKSLPYLLK